jgi:hypothetical protein
MIAQPKPDAGTSPGMPSRRRGRRQFHVPRVARQAIILAVVWLLTACGSSNSVDRLGADPSSAEPPELVVKVEATKEGKPTGTPPPESEAGAVATRFATAWARPDVPAERWWADIRPLCAHQYAPLLRSIDPADITIRRITGPTEAVGRHAGDRTYAIPTDAGTLHITVTPQAGQWKVNGQVFLPEGLTTVPNPPQPKPTP